ncbi:MAG: hypothetical protein RLZZ387_4703 [Chloroflexota bacterium]|jgi:hypothetical protein
MAVQRGRSEGCDTRLLWAGRPCSLEHDAAGSREVDTRREEGIGPCNRARAHEALLAAYAPDDALSFRKRVWAHQVVQCVETIHAYDEHRDAFDDEARTAGVRASWETLVRLLRSGAAGEITATAGPAT